MLLLGCGDVRNILCTLYSTTCRPLNFKLHITMCDFEPAVLARNILLLSLLAKNGPKLDINVAWCLFYNLFITDRVLYLVQDHAGDLVQLSDSLETWTASSYGKTFRFTNESSLARVRELWKQYVGTRTMSSEAAKQYENRARKAIKAIVTVRGKGYVLQGIRSLGLYGMLGMEVMNNTFQLYWETGVVGGESDDCAALKKCHGGHVNPLFAFSSSPRDEFAVHYGTDPLTSFSLAEAFDGSQLGNTEPDVVVNAAKKQFKSWCKAFVDFIRPEKVAMLFHCGDAINLCYELQAHSPSGCNLPPWTRQYAQPWSAEGNVLHEFHSGMYDVIDTSNLVDHVGTLNILPAVAPLLGEGSHCVLYMEHLLRAAEDTSLSLQKLLSADITAASLLIGLAPIGQLLVTTADHTGAEVALQELLTKKDLQPRQRQFRLRIPWRKAYGGDAVAMSALSSTLAGGCDQMSMDPKELALCLLQWYIEIFADKEDLSRRFETITRSMRAPLAGDLNFYSRVTIVALLSLARRNIRTDWDSCIDRFVEMVLSNRSLLINSNSFQEFFIHLHVAGLWHSPDFEKDPRSNLIEFGPPRDSRNEIGLLGKPDLPGYIHVALVVPRNKLRVFTDDSPERIGTPGLHLSTYNEPLFENSFFGIDAMFGSLRDVGAEDRCEVVVDPAGWRGKADLIVTCVMPTFPFLVGRRSATRVALCVDTSPSTAQYTLKLGFTMCVFDAGLDDTQNLKLLRQAPELRQAAHPMHPMHPRQPRTIPPSTHVDHYPDDLAKVVVSANGKVDISIRAKIPRPANGEALSSDVPVNVTQQSPCCVALNIGDRVEMLGFPFPVDGQTCKTRVARKQLWVEVIARTSLANEPGGYSVNPFPVVATANSLLPWSLSMVNLDQQPLVRGDPGLDILKPHLGMGLSRTERQMQSGIRSKSATLDFKETVATMAVATARDRPRTSSGTKLPWLKSFLLTRNGNCDTVLFAHALRHDHDANSVVIDAFVVPLTDDRVDNLATPIGNLVNDNDSPSFNISENEKKLWKKAMPAFVERCRSTWSHRSECEYGSPPTVPLSIKHGDLPICTCGEGHETSFFPSKFAGFAKYATRIAIPVLSAIPYVESMEPDLEHGPGDAGSSRARNDRAEMSTRDTASTDACANCGTSKQGLKACIRCGRVRYCNHACQKADWKAHKKVCGK